MAKETDPIKAAEKRGYAKGYIAGKAKRAKLLSYEQILRRDNALWNRAFLAALPACITADGWTITKADGTEQRISDVAEKTKLARDFATEAFKHLRTP